MASGDKPNQGKDLRCYRCTMCGWVYDPARGDERGRIGPGTAFADLPKHWLCPKCGAPKRYFVPGAVEEG